MPNYVRCSWRHAKQRYGKQGKGRFGHAINWRPILRILRQRHGRELAADFGPRKLLTLRDDMPSFGWARKYCNQELGRVKQMFKWAVAHEYVPAHIHGALATVEGLRKGATEAHENAPILPVDDDVVNATLPHMRAVVADLVQLQRLTGCRPGEVVRIRPMDVDRSGDVWTIRFEEHKTAHHDKDRTIYVGPRAQAILGPRLLKLPHVWCFSSRPGYHYTTDTYCRAVQRACGRAGVPKWSPNQLRHTSATAVRAEYDAEYAQGFLGHSDLRTTQIYAEKSKARAEEVARKLG